MNVLMISGDPNLLKTGAEARESRAIQESVVEHLEVCVWPSVHSTLYVWRVARKRRWSVITSQDPFWRGLLAWWLARTGGAKLNLQVHADLEGQSVIKRALARLLLPRADSVRVVSERVRRQVLQTGVHVPVHVLAVFVDTSRFSSITRTPVPGMVLWVGRFEEEKDPLLALEVIQHTPNATLVMIGSGSLDAVLRTHARDLPVEFHGWQNPLPYLKQAAVVLSTSRYESFGASIVEALAAGVPVVAPDVGVAREAGAIVAPREELAEAVVKVLQSGARGQLRLSIPTAKEWALKWKESLV